MKQRVSDEKLARFIQERPPLTGRDVMLAMASDLRDAREENKRMIKAISVGSVCPCTWCCVCIDTLSPFADEKIQQATLAERKGDSKCLT